MRLTCCAPPRQQRVPLSPSPTANRHAAITIHTNPNQPRNRPPKPTTISRTPPPQDYVADITSDQCRALVKQYQALAAQDIRFDVPLADACYEDRTKLCGSVPPVRFASFFGGVG